MTQTPAARHGITPGGRIRSELLVLGLLLIAAALMLPSLGAKGLWIDEADSVYFAEHAWPDLVLRLCDPHPPGYYALLRVFILLAGAGEFVVRLPSALAALLSIAALARLTRESDLVPGLPPRLPAALLAVAPLHIWYAQEARMYAIVMLLGLTAAIFAVRLAHRRRWADAAGYAISAAAAMLTDQSALPVLLGLNLVWLLVSRKRLAAREHVRVDLGRWGVLQIVAAAPFVLWWAHADNYRRVTTGALYPLTMVQLTLDRWIGFLRAQPWIALAALGALVIGGAVLTHAWRHRVLLALRDRRWQDLVVPMLVWSLVVLYGCGTLLSVVPRLYTLKRLTLPLLPYALLAAAWALSRLPLSRTLVMIILPASLVMSLVNVAWVAKPPWREAVAAVDARIAPGDIVFVDDLAYPAFDYYFQGDAVTHPWTIENLDALAAAAPTAHRLWLVTQHHQLRYLLGLYPHLDRTGLIWSATWPNIEVRAYDPARLGPQALTPQAEIPPWMLGLPSPLDEACRAP